MTFDELKEKALSLPFEPGVYVMRDKSDKVIYVGKSRYDWIFVWFWGKCADATVLIKANIIDFEFWVIAADRPVDINVYLSQLQLLYNNVQDNARRKLIVDDINKANMFMSNNVVDTEYYLLFKEKDSELIQKRIRTLINAFASAGLTCRQTTNDDLRIILDNFLNGGQTTTFGTVMS